MKKNAIVQIICCLAFILSVGYYGVSCNPKDKRDNLNEKIKIQQKESFSKEDSLKILILKGDTIAYLKLRDIYVDNDNAPELLAWALIMANGYKYSSAYYDVYFCFQQIGVYYSKGANNSLNNIDSTTKRLAISYLLKASEVGDSDAKKILNQYFTTGK